MNVREGKWLFFLLSFFFDSHKKWNYLSLAALCLHSNQPPNRSIHVTHETVFHIRLSHSWYFDSNDQKVAHSFFRPLPFSLFLFRRISVIRACVPNFWRMNLISKLSLSNDSLFPDFPSLSFLPFFRCPSEKWERKELNNVQPIRIRSRFSPFLLIHEEWQSISVRPCLSVSDCVEGRRKRRTRTRRGEKVPNWEWMRMEGVVLMGHFVLCSSPPILTSDIRRGRGKECDFPLTAGCWMHARRQRGRNESL